MKTRKEISESLKHYQYKGAGNGSLYTATIGGISFTNDNDNRVWIFDGWEKDGYHDRPVKLYVIGSAGTKPEFIQVIQSFLKPQK